MRTTERILDLGLAKPRLSLVTRLVLSFRQISSIWRVLQNRSQINALHELDDSQLMDIGLTRRDVESALQTSIFFEDPSSHLTRSARRRARLAASGALQD